MVNQVRAGRSFTQCLNKYTKYTCRVKKKISNKFHLGELTIIIFLVFLPGVALNLEKVGRTFSSFNQCSSLPYVSTDDSKQF